MGIRETVATARTLPRVGAYMDMDRQKPAQLLFESREMTYTAVVAWGRGIKDDRKQNTLVPLLFVLRFYNVKITH
jgi:hypothetical protein